MTFECFDQLGRQADAARAIRALVNLVNEEKANPMRGLTIFSRHGKTVPSPRMVDSAGQRLEFSMRFGARQGVPGAIK